MAKMMMEHSMNTDFEIMQHHFGVILFMSKVQSLLEYRQRIEGMLTGIRDKTAHPYFQEPSAPGICYQSANRDRCGNSQQSIHSLHSRGPTAADIFLFYLETIPNRDSRPHVANVFVAQKWVLGGREKFKLTTFSATHLIQGAPPPPCPFPQLGAVSQAPWVPHTMLGTNSVIPHPSFFSTASGGGQMPKVEADRKGEAQGDWDEGQPSTWGSGEVAKLRGEECCCPECSSGPWS